MAQHPASLDPCLALAEHIEQVRCARDGGFAAIYAGQHYLSQPYWMLQERLGATDIAVRAQRPGLPHADVLRTLGILASEVIPAI